MHATIRVLFCALLSSSFGCTDLPERERDAAADAALGAVTLEAGSFLPEAGILPLACWATWPNASCAASRSRRSR